MNSLKHIRCRGLASSQTNVNISGGTGDRDLCPIFLLCKLSEWTDSSASLSTFWARILERKS